MQQPLIINACLTGMVPTKDNNPALPVTPEEIIEDAVRCAELGASIVHIHARDKDEKPTWKAQVYADIIEGIRERNAELVICVTTSGRNWPEIDKRAACLGCGADMASLTLGSLNFPRSVSMNSADTIVELLKRIIHAGMRPEFEAFEVGMIDWARDYLIPKTGLKPPYYFNLLLGSRGTMACNARNVATLVDALPSGSVWALAGIGRYQAQANLMAIALGGHVRVGLEDNVYYTQDKSMLATNPMLIKRVVRMAEMYRRPISTCAHTREVLGL